MGDVVGVVVGADVVAAVGDVDGVVVGADVGGQALQSAGQAMVMLTAPTTGIVWMVPHIAVVAMLHSDG